MKKFNSGLVMALASALFVPTQAVGIGVEGALGGWLQMPGGDMSYEKLDSDDVLDINDDLNYDNENRLYGRLKIDMPLFVPNVYLMATPISFDGTGRKSVDFNFGDTTFNANQSFDSELKLDHLDLALFYDLPVLEMASIGLLNVEVGINLRIIDFKAEIKQSESGLKETESATLPVPMLYLGAQLKPLDWLAFETEGRGIGYNGNGYYSWIGRVRFDVMAGIYAAGGYRYDQFKYDDDDFDADVEFGGPFFEAGFSF